MFDKIKGLCREKDITIAELERRADLAPRSVYKWADVMPAADKVARVAKVLGVTIEELLEDPEEEEAV